jgi:hydrogenase maturation protease
MGADAEEHPGDAAGLLERFGGAECVVLIDAIAGCGRAGRVHVWDCGSATGAAWKRGCASSHGLGVAEAIGLAQALGRLPGKVRVYGIEGCCFEPGAAVSPEVAAAVERVARRIASLQA